MSTAPLLLVFLLLLAVALQLLGSRAARTSASLEELARPSTMRPPTVRRPAAFEPEAPPPRRAPPATSAREATDDARASLKRAVVVMEILGRPRALRDRTWHDPP